LQWRKTKQGRRIVVEKNLLLLEGTETAERRGLEMWERRESCWWDFFFFLTEVGGEMLLEAAGVCKWGFMFEGFYHEIIEILYFWVTNFSF